MGQPVKNVLSVFLAIVSWHAERVRYGIVAAAWHCCSNHALSHWLPTSVAGEYAGGKVGLQVECTNQGIWSGSVLAAVSATLQRGSVRKWQKRTNYRA